MNKRRQAMFRYFLTSSVKSKNTIRNILTHSKPLNDKYGRSHDYLRISITERCNLRCRYCMPEEGIQLSKREECLDLAEMKRLSDIFVKFCGINKIRLTGGEPTVNKKLVPLLEHLNELRKNGLKTLAMTTNGLTLKKNSVLFKNLGLNAINISLDTMKVDRFEHLTRRKGWNLVYQGLISAIETRFDSLKLNCVIMKGFNEDEIIGFTELAQKYPIEVRFIEFMPFAGNNWAVNRMLPYKQMLRLVFEKFPDLKKVPSNSNEVSKVYKDKSMLGSIGFISSMSDNFCSGCNRLRLTSDGYLKVCLFGREETSLRDLMRNGANDTEIAKAIASSLEHKKMQHSGAINLQNETLRPMIKIGVRLYHSSVSGNDDSDSNFSHLNQEGKAIMVDVGGKADVKRTALAQGRIYVGAEVLAKLGDQSFKKGDIITVSKIAGILGAKSTSLLIPLCHQIPLDNVNINIETCEHSGSLLVTAMVEARYRTGVEMESLTAVAITLLTLYDMCKSINKSMMPLSLILPGYTMSSKLESQAATIIIGWYTFVLHLLAAFYFLDVYRGSSSDWVPSPLFEYPKETMHTFAIILAIYSFLYMIIASLGLIRGVKTDTRIYYFPWLFLTAIETFLLFYQVSFLVWKYHHDADTNLMAVVIFIFALYHTYLYLIVLSNYRYLKRIQNPTLIFPPEI